MHRRSSRLKDNGYYNPDEDPNISYHENLFKVFKKIRKTRTSSRATSNADSFSTDTPITESQSDGLSHALKTQSCPPMSRVTFLSSKETPQAALNQSSSQMIHRNSTASSCRNSLKSKEKITSVNGVGLKKGSRMEKAYGALLVILLFPCIWFFLPSLTSFISSTNVTENFFSASRLMIQDLEARNAKLVQELSDAHLKSSPAPYPDSSTAPVHNQLTPELQRAMKKWLTDRIFGRPMADKMANFALETQGASVIGTRCSDTYNVDQSYVSLFGFTMFHPARGPCTVIQGDPVLPGRCWAFHGAQGTLAISLSHPIRITHVTLDHLSRYNSPTDTIDSAPKDSEIYGMKDNSEEGTLLGTFTYDKHGEQTQTFKLPNPSDEVYRAVRLQVLNNWGNVKYTCLYRFRVHGKIATEKLLTDRIKESSPLGLSTVTDFGRPMVDKMADFTLETQGAKLTPELQQAMEKWLTNYVKEYNALGLSSVTDFGHPMADKMVNFALETQGASVIRTRCSDTYNVDQSSISLFGFTVWYQTRSPCTVIQGDPVLSGRCWPFNGAQGTLAISLSHPIRITHVTLDHPSRYNSPTDTIDSAPKDFEIYGMKNNSEEGTLLGTFTYDEHGEQTQTLKLPNPSDEVYRAVRLQVLNNWGNVKYTCLYRFRVHGKIATEKWLTDRIKESSPLGLSTVTDFGRPMVDKMADFTLETQGAKLTAELQQAIEKWLTDYVKEYNALGLSSVTDFGRPMADKMADFALETQGASVIRTRCSDTYNVDQSCVLFGFSVFHPARGPCTVIQGDPVLSGRCWPFHGAQGTLAISLSYPIRITHVTLDHLSRYNSPTDTIDSAPKDFGIYGMKNNSEEGTLLGTFTYEEHGEQTQTFKLPNPSEEVYKAVKLRVLNNWGNDKYTCLYRFRVHGKIANL